MKTFVQAALAATLLTSVAAQPHAHQHRHAKKHEHVVVEKRDVTVTSVVPATVTVYVLEGKEVDINEAKKGIAGGDYIVVGSSTPTFTPPPPPPPSTSSAPSSSATLGGQFFEQKSSSSSSSSAAPSPSAPPPPPPGPSVVAPGAPFPTDNPPSCDVDVTTLGLVPIPWLNNHGWASIQQPVGGFTPGVKIPDIVTPIAGGCTPGSLCVGACPPGMVWTQFPETSQGATGQSVGGLFCDSNNKLQLTRPEFPSLCIPGAGGVSIKNTLDVLVSTCQTVYPGTEAMVIPTVAQPGQTVPLANPDANTSYKWEGAFTSGQFYINPKGVGPSDGCTWGNGGDKGNWAPMNAGVGKDTHGITYLSIFRNTPTSNAQLDFNVSIEGDVTVECKYENGVFSNGDPHGCTTAISKDGGQATYVYY